jgi:hypothetical protein
MERRVVEIFKARGITGNRAGERAYLSYQHACCTWRGSRAKPVMVVPETAWWPPDAAVVLGNQAR